MNRNNLGGFNGSVANATVSSGVIITAPTVYNSSGDTYAVIRGAGSDCPGGTSGDLIGLKCALFDSIACHCRAAPTWSGASAAVFALPIWLHAISLVYIVINCLYFIMSINCFFNYMCQHNPALKNPACPRARSAADAPRECWQCRPASSFQLPARGVVCF